MYIKYIIFLHKISYKNYYIGISLIYYCYHYHSYHVIRGRGHSCKCNRIGFFFRSSDGYYSRITLESGS